jgi:hypothetical protein
VFKDENHIDEIKGIYVPFWLFDADAYGNMTYKATRVRSWIDSDYYHTQTMHYQVNRAGTLPFRNVPVDGSSKMDDKLMESIEPFDFNQAEEFNAAYLAGYSADRYDVSKEETFGRATTRFRQGTEAAFRRDIHGYDTLEVKESILQFSNTEARYALYPVWLLHTKWKDDHFYFAVNGESGKIAGNLPVSPLKFTLFLLLFWIIFGGAIFGITFAILEEGVLIPLLVGLGIGLIIAIAIMVLWRRQMKNVRFQYGAANYEKPGSLRIDRRKDIFLYKKVTRTKIQSSSSKK